MMAKNTTEILINQNVLKWVFLKEDSSLAKDFELLNNSLPLKIKEIDSKGKTIYLVLYNEFGTFYILHNSGKWKNKQDKYSVWYLLLENGETIWYSNQKNLRKSISITTEKYIFKSILEKIGVDILSYHFSLPKWRELIENNKYKNITSLLTNRNIISGCSSIVKSEALYRSGISPMRKVKTLNNNEIETLYQSLRIISRLIYNDMMIYKVYKQDNSEKIKTADGRITYWDSNYQK